MQVLSVGIITALLWSWLATIHSSQAYAYEIEVSFPTGTNTAKGSGTVYYSRSQTLTPTLSASDLQAFYAAKNIDVNQVESISITPPSGGNGTATCSTPLDCTFSSVSGSTISLNMQGQYTVSGYFDWWRNNPGTRGYWWSYDLNGGTHYGSVEQALIDQGDTTSSIASRDFPGGSYYDLWGGDASPIDLSGYTFGGNGVSGLSSNYVVLTGADITGSEYATLDPASVYIPSSGFRVAFYTTDGPFDGTTPDYVVRSPDNPRGLGWKYDISVTGTGYTYAYESKWTITVTMKTTSPPPGNSPSPGGSSPSPTPTPTPIDGDFDIVQPTIDYRDSFKLVPKPFTIPQGCTYVSHKYRFRVDNDDWYTSEVTSRTAETAFSYSSYPLNLIVGTNNVSIKITASCGDSGYIKEKPLVVNDSGRPNEPPVFDVGWFKEYSGSKERTRDHKRDYLVIGQEYDLSIVRESNADPEKVLPRDPEGDYPITFTWHFAESASPFIRSLADRYGDISHEELFKSVDVPDDRSLIGNHPVRITAKDSLEAESSRIEDIYIYGPEPIADIEPIADVDETVVKSRRPFPANAFDVSGSWSPLGRSIVDYKWENYLPFYVNDGDTSTYETVKLWVKDSAGLWSTKPATGKVKVLPDPPPIAKGKLAPIGIREQPVSIYNQSYSIDGDTIVSAEYQYKYDGNNNGFEDDVWTDLSGDLIKATFTPTMVGKYLFKIKAVEDYGKWDDTLSEPESTMTLDVVNDYPSVSFDIEGKNKQPDYNSANTYNANQMFGWNLYETNTNTLITDKWRWYVENGLLNARSGRDYWSQRQYVNFYNDENGAYRRHNSDNGYGTNQLSPWRTLNVAGSTKPLQNIDGSDIRLHFDDGPYDNGWDRLKFTANDRYIYHNYGGAIRFIDKQKLAQGSTSGRDYTVKQITAGQSITATISFQDQWWDNYYDTEDGSNYAQVAGFVPYYSQSTGTITNLGWSTNEEKTYPLYALADETIYVSATVQFLDGGNIYNGYPSTKTYLRKNTISKSGIASFDAQTGEFLGFSDTAGYASEFFTDKDDLILLPSSTDSSSNLSKAMRFNRKMEKVAETKPFEGKPCTELISRFYKAGDYGYVAYAKCEYVNSASKNLHVVNVKSDLTLGWRTPTVYDMADNREVGDNTNEAWNMEKHLIPVPQGNYVIARSREGVDRNERIGTSYIRLSDGVVINTNGNWDSNNPEFRVDWNGGVTPQNNGSTYADGGFDGYAPNGLNRYLFDGYYGDGIKFETGTYRGARDDYYYINVRYGTYNQNYVHNPHILGQFVSNDTAENTEFNVSLSMKEPIFDSKLAGFSFRMQDPANRYSVETDGANVYLARYVGGTRTVLQSQPYVFDPKRTYSFKINNSGNQIRVWMNGIPLFDTTDNQFTTGRFGYFADKAFVSFGSIQLQQLVVGETQWISGYAIWDEVLNKAEAIYKNINYSDPENDPAMAFRWSYQHTPKFLNNFGVSLLNGNTYGRPEYFSYQNGSDIVATFDKIGVFTISLNATDDPHPWYTYPSNLFDSYRKTSNTVQRKFIVHRKPKAVYSLSKRWDGVVLWNDTSYDPDRFDPNNGNYMAPENGLNYSTTRGITERKYYYISPSGNRVEQKLVRPAEGGIYTVGMQVKDEYGAWSDWVTATIDVLPVPQNPPPTVQLTQPNGTAASPALIYTTTPTITWNQNDSPGTIFQGYYVKIEEKTGSGVYKFVMETGRVGQWTTNNSQSHVVPANILEEGKTYRVQVKADDGELESDWSNLGYMIINAPPRVTITNPNGTKENPTIITGDKRPTISFLQNDDQYAYFNRFSIQILDEAGNEIYGAWNRWQGTNATANSFEVDQDLPTNQLLQARMWVSDNADVWSQQSNTVWFKINFPPSITMTNPSGTYDNPTMGSPTPTITWSMGDPDPNTVFSKVRLLVRNEDATVVYVDKELFVNSSETTGSYNVTTPLPAGEKVRVTAMVWDDNGAASPWATETWMFTNRPPTADFDWSPKPVWEGDTVHLINQSGDPDGDLLSFVWEVTAPDGAKFSYNTTDVTAGFLLAGPYTVKLTATDGFATSQVTKVITAQPLTIQSDVEHTPEWLANHLRLNHNTTVRPIDFYSGEIFVVHTRSSPAPVSKAEAWIDTIGLDGNELNINTELAQSGDDSTLFTGEIFDDRLLSLTEGLPKGNQTVHFRITYANGVIKEEDVPVTIIGNAREFVQVHRVK